MIRNTDETTTAADLRVAMILGRPVTIDYERADGTRTVRVVEIFEIVDRDHAAKRPFFRAMDRLSRDFRSFRFDRLYAYRVSNARGRYKVARPARERSMEFSVFTESDTPTAAANGPVVDWDAEWADFNELQYDPDAPVPFLPADYPEA
jgi:predicted DNA-binding transcriptional regulator YafY